MKQGLKHSRASSRVENLVKDVVEINRLFFLLTSLPSHSSQNIFKVIITVLIEHLHGFFHGKTGYHQ